MTKEERTLLVAVRNRLTNAWDEADLRHNDADVLQARRDINSLLGGAPKPKRVRKPKPNPNAETEAQLAARSLGHVESS